MIGVVVYSVRVDMAMKSSVVWIRWWEKVVEIGSLC